MYRSDDKGLTWKSVDTKLKAPKGLVVLSADGKVILHRPDMSTTTYRSDDNGATWTTVDLDGGQTQNSRIVADPVNPDVFYVVDAQAYLYRSDDGGKTFAKFGARLSNESASEYYNGAGLIRTVPGKEGVLWVPMDQAQVWLPKGFSENGLAFTEDGGKSWNRCEGASTAIAVGLGKAKEGGDYETIFIWGAAKSGDAIGVYRSTDKCKTFERINDDAHQYGGPGNGNFVQGDMNNFGVVYMSTVGRGTVVGAPEGTKFIEVTDPSVPVVGPTGFAKLNFANASMQLFNRNLHVHTPVDGKVVLFDMEGRKKFAASVFGNMNLSLERVPKGIYVAKLVGIDGKVYLKQNFTLK